MPDATNESGAERGGWDRKKSKEDCDELVSARIMEDSLKFWKNFALAAHPKKFLKKI